MATANIQTTAALHEERSLSDYYRTRNLYLAQTVLDLEAENARLTAELAAVKPAPENSEEQ